MTMPNNNDCLRWFCSHCSRPLFEQRAQDILRVGIRAYCSDYCKGQHEHQEKTKASMEEWYQRLQEARQRIKQEQSEHTARWALCDW